jgi:hypothetical protein
VKRILAFIVLLALGIAALRLAIGDEDAMSAADNGATSTQNTNRKRPRNQGTPGVKVAQNAGASISQSGPLTFGEWRPIDLGGGHMRKEDIFILRATDSQQIGDGLQHLIGVTVELFDKGTHAATVVASDAFVELGRNANGEPAFKENKKIEVRSMVITAEPNSDMAGITLELGDGTIAVGDNEIQLTTEPDQPVKVTFEGERNVTLTGTGAKARLPRTKDGGLQKAQVTIERDPILVTEDLRLSATGRLHYVENTVTGAAQISMDDDVELEVTHATMQLPGMRSDTGDPLASRRSTIRGDQFVGWLLRNRDGKGNRPRTNKRERRGATDGAMLWQRLLLVGAPATIDVPGVHVATPRIMVRPGVLGDPFIVSAHGGESRIQQTELSRSERQEDLISGISPRRIHVVRPSNTAGALHRAVGFPQWTLRSLEQQQLFIFEGASRFESGARTIKASNGLVIIRRDVGENAIVQGFGEIEVFQRGTPKKPGGKPQPDLIAKSSDGMLLTKSEGREHLRLGPAIDETSRRWREHRYSVKFGKASVKGLGACEVERVGDRTTLELRAPFNEIEADFDTEGTRLRNVRQLLATLVDETLTDLDVGGLPVKATFIHNGETLLTQAPRVRQIGPQSLRLLPMDLDESPWSEMTELDRTPRLARSWRDAREGGEPQENTVEVIGPRIDIHHAGGQNAIIDAHQHKGELPHIYAKVPQRGSDEPTTVSCSAERLRVLPFVLTPEARRMHLGGARSLLTETVMHSIAQAWLIVDRVNEFQLDAEQQGNITGTGDRLLISQGSEAVLFIGDPDAQTPAFVQRTHEGRTVQMQGARVRVRNEGVVRLSALGAFEGRSIFLSPTMTLHEPGSRSLLSHMRAICRGNIHIEPDAVRFDGSVEAHGLTPDGQDDPDGVHIDAIEMVMNRHTSGKELGKVKDIRGKDVVIDWTRLGARAADIYLNFVSGDCIAADPKGAEVTLPTGQELRTTRIAVNYKTWAISTGPGRTVQRSDTLGGQQ